MKLNGVEVCEHGIAVGSECFRCKKMFNDLVKRINEPLFVPVAETVDHSQYDYE